MHPGIPFSGSLPPDDAYGDPFKVILINGDFMGLHGRQSLTPDTQNFTDLEFFISAGSKLDVNFSSFSFIRHGLDPSSIVGPVPVPEPTTLVLLGTGTICVIGRHRRNRD